MNRREFCALPLLLAGCGVDEMGQEFQLQPSPVRTAHAASSPVPNFGTGTWTPIVGGTATYGGDTWGRYVKIGPLVFIEGSIEITLIGTGNTSGIFGMPFSAKSFGTISIGVTDSLATNIVSIVGRIYGSQIDLWSRTAASATPALNAVLGDGALIEFSGWHFTTANV